jgi:flagellar biosynthetic protein FliP
MLSPMLVSLPFKLLLFVLVDGWAMTVSSLAATYTV